MLTSDRSPAGVRAALVDIAREEGEMEEEEARAYIARLELTKRVKKGCAVLYCSSFR